MERIRACDSLAVAFSGGVDSSLLAAVAYEVLGDRAVAMTGESPTHPQTEKELARQIARTIGLRHVFFITDELRDARFLTNNPERCYFCKRRLFAAMRIQADRLGLQEMAHGANVDDQSDFRPGFKAALELGVKAPLIEAGLRKQDIRMLARALGLPNWDRPAMACLVTRVPYGTPISLDLIQRIGQAEAVLRELGYAHCRVRHHDHLARIEVPPEDIERISHPDNRRQVVEQLRQIGYAHICIDLEGYISGKMNREI